MTILTFSAENVKKLSVVEFRPTPTGLVIVSGKNGSGKTSCLDTIEMVLAGADHIPSKPVRKGQDKASGELDLGEFIVKRTITASGGGSLIVRNKDGIKMESPQKLLDTLYRGLSFDPLEFARHKPADRSKTLRDLLGLDFSKQDEEYKRLYDERTQVNKIAKNKEERLKSSPRAEGAPAEEQSSAKILADQRRAIEHNQDNAARRRRVLEAKNRAEGLAELAAQKKATCSDTRKEIERLQKLEESQIAGFDRATGDAEAALNLAKGFEKEAADLKDEDVARFADDLGKLEAVNAAVRQNKFVDELAKEFKERTKESEALTRKLADIERAKRDAIASAKFPVEGLGLSDTNEVTFAGIPFDNASTAEQLKISVAMGLAMNPKLRVLLIRQGNDLDSENLKLVAEMAAAANAQIWLERCREDGEVAVIIEDGAVASYGTATPVDKEEAK